MPNIKFSYRYCDCNNYKRYGFVIFDNPTNIGLSILEALISSKLIYDEFFYADEWKLPEFFHEYCDFRIDQTWHEFESIEYTDEPTNTPLDITDFVKIVEKTRWIY
jgi:hypothetical protein